MPQLSLAQLTQVAGPLCAKAGMRLSAWRPIRLLRDGAEVVLRIPPQRGLKYLSAQAVQAGVGVVGFENADVLFEQHVIREVGKQLYKLVEADGFTRLLLDFGNVQFLSSTMLATLIGLKKRIDSVHGRLLFCNLNPILQDTLRIGKIQQLFEIFETEHAALANY